MGLIKTMRCLWLAAAAPAVVLLGLTQSSASADDPKPEASAQSIVVQEGGTPGVITVEVREGPEGRVQVVQQTAPANPAELERTQLTQRARRLQAALRSLGEKKNSEEGRRLQDMLREVQERLEALSRQAAGATRGTPGPERERLARELEALKRTAAELREVGKPEEAERLGRQAREIAGQLKARGERREAERVEFGGMRLGGPLPGQQPAGGAMGATFSADPFAPNPVEVRKMQIRSAIQLLRQAGLNDEAAQVERKLETFEREAAQMQQRAGSMGFAAQIRQVAELREQVEQLRCELNELRALVKKAAGDK